MRAHKLRKLFEFAGRFNHSQTRHRRRDLLSNGRAEIVVARGTFIEAFPRLGLEGGHL